MNGIPQEDVIKSSDIQNFWYWNSLCVGDIR